MDSLLPSRIIEKLTNLISYSCTQHIEPDPTYLSLHKGIIKLYFTAREVEMDYKNKIVKVEIPISTTEYTAVSFECQDMARFIKSCIKKDKKSLLYYQNVLIYYGELEVA